MFLKKWGICACLLIALLSACSKKDMSTTITPTPTPVTPASATYQQLLADSVFSYAKQIYYWNTLLPDSATFKPRGYAKSDTLAGLQSELLQITRIPINPVTGLPYEQAINYVNGVPTNDNSTSKFSYIVKTSDTKSGGASSNIIFNQSDVKGIKMTLDGKENDLGFIPGFIPVRLTTETSEKIPYTDADSTVGYVRYVTTGSPAYNAGLRRGDIISKYNGNSWSYDNNSAQIINALDAAAITLTIYKPSNNSSKEVPITKAIYTFNPVFKDTVLNVNGKKIGYIAYKSFTDETNSKPALDAVFSKFSGITDVVVDLRYNGGGYVNVSEYFADLLIPASANNKVLFAEYYNQTMINKQATLLKNQQVYDANDNPQGYTYFDIDYSVAKNTTMAEKTGGVNMNNEIQNIYFIVSSGTASASELLINSLKPYFSKVVLIGAAFSDPGKKTYGKPVGFFEMRLGKYSMFIANFETKNALGAGGYYDGLTTDFQYLDDIRYDFGNPSEACLRGAIRKIIGDESYSPISSLRSVRSASPTVPATQMIGRDIGPVTNIQDMFMKLGKK